MKNIFKDFNGPVDRGEQVTVRSFTEEETVDKRRRSLQRKSHFQSIACSGLKACFVRCLDLCDDICVYLEAKSNPGHAGHSLALWHKKIGWMDQGPSKT